MKPTHGLPSQETPPGHRFRIQFVEEGIDQDAAIAKAARILRVNPAMLTAVRGCYVNQPISRGSDGMSKPWVRRSWGYMVFEWRVELQPKLGRRVFYKSC